MSKNHCAILIPTYKPDEKLIELLGKLVSLNTPILIVNDGSANFSEVSQHPIFKNPLIMTFSHYVNLGKGRALKTGINYLLNQFPDLQSIVTADADGQHRVEDIESVMKAANNHENALIIGARQFDGDVPLRSKFGNVVTSQVLFLFAGLKLRDTQSGLRAIPRKFMLEILGTHGERYEWETNMLLKTKELNVKIVEVPIATVYIEENKTSHFNPILDSMRIYFLILRFLFSSFITYIIDNTLFTILIPFMSLGMSMIIARFVAGIVNFNINKNFVFKSEKRKWIAFAQYFSLVIVFGFVVYYTIDFFHTRFGLPVLLVKIATETVLFFASFTFQRDFIFLNRQEED